MKPLAVAVACVVPFCCLTAKAQSGASDLARARDEFISKVFTRCGGIYYFGPHEVNHLGCTIVNPTNRVSTAREVTGCAELIEYKDFDLAPSVTVVHRGAGSEPMDLDPRGILRIPDPAGVERVLLLITYASHRSRMRVTSRPVEDVNGSTQAWEPWGKSIPNVTPSTFVNLGDDRTQYQLPPGTKAFGVMIRENGQWIFAPGPDFPLETSLTQVFARVGLGLGPIADALAEPTRALGPAAILRPVPELMAEARVIQKIAAEKATCGAPITGGMGPPVPRVAPRSQIQRDGSGAVVITSIHAGEQSEFRVWYRRGGAPFMLSAVITDPESDWKIEWNGFYQNGQFHARAIKVTLGGKEYGVYQDNPDQRRVYGDLIQRLQANVDSAFHIADRYNLQHPNDDKADTDVPQFLTLSEGLAPAGVRSAAAASATQGAAPVSSLPAAHAADDTFARMVSIVNRNMAAGVTDPLAPYLRRFTPLPVCYSITTRCLPAGEVVRVPGDLDVAPDFWDTLGRRCGPMAHAYQIEVSVKGSPKRGRREYIDCSTAFELASRRKTLLRYGASR